MSGWKWLGDLRVQLCIIAALVFTIWIAVEATLDDSITRAINV